VTPPTTTAAPTELAPPPSWTVDPQRRSWRDHTPTGSPTGAAPGEVTTFHRQLPGYAPTPLVEVPALAEQLGLGAVCVKDESSRLGLPAFKALGASWAVARVIAERAGSTDPLDLEGLRAAVAERPLQLVTATDGNHGRALARMAALVGANALVVVPDVVAPRAVELIAAEGAYVVVLSADYDAAVAEAARLAEEHHEGPERVLVQDTSWPGYEVVPGWIVEGYRTLLVEVDDQLAATGRAADLVIVPVGVGSLAQAVVSHYRRPQLAPGDAPAVMSVEPDTAACVLTSLQRGELTSVATGSTSMAGLNCGTPSSLAWPVLSGGLDAAAAVDDDAAARAADDLAAAGVPAGPCGAASLAALRQVLTGPGAAERRAALGLGPDAVVVLLSTEGTASGSGSAMSTSMTSAAS